MLPSASPLIPGGLRSEPLNQLTYVYQIAVVFFFSLVKKKKKKN